MLKLNDKFFYNNVNIAKLLAKLEKCLDNQGNLYVLY